MNPIFLPCCLFTLFFVTAVVQIFYFLFFFSRVAFFRNHTATAGDDAPPHPLSVVICARDEAPALSSRLPSVLSQDYPSPCEVLVVDDNSFDDTKYVLNRMATDHPQLKVLELVQESKLIPGKKFPLSMGIKSARYNLLLMTDADCTPASSNWMEKMAGAYKDGIEVVLGYGPYEKKPGLLNKLIRFETFHTALQYFSFAEAGIPYMGVGRNLSYKRDLFLRNKGFSAHHHIPSGDDDLFINTVAGPHNTAIQLDPDTFVYSAPKTNWRDWLRQKRRHYTTAKYYKPMHQILLGLYSVTHILFYPLLVACIFLLPHPFDWVSEGLFGFRFLVQGIVYARSVSKLKEKDLFWFFPFFDLWQCLYYLIFAPALWKRPGARWK